MKRTLLASLVSVLASTGFSQLNENKLGAWYMYFFNKSFNESKWGFQGDIQYRNWNLMGDLEQLLLRGGVTYKAVNKKLTLTLGYGNITTGAYGDSDATISESRIYQEALFPHRLGSRFYLVHRFRYEQRFVEGQDFRTRFRYNFFINVPLNNTELIAGALYLAFYNELFINGEKDIGDGRRVKTFDRNRTYLALGYGLKNNLRLQAGMMHQITDPFEKTQLQLSLHHSF